MTALKFDYYFVRLNVHQYFVVNYSRIDLFGNFIFLVTLFEMIFFSFACMIIIFFVCSADSVDSSMMVVSTQTLKLHMSCVKGLHHHVPILFDYYHFAVIDTTIHATVTALGLPNHR